VSVSGIWATCKSALCSRQKPCQHPTTQFLQAGCPSCCPTNSVKALKAQCGAYLEHYLFCELAIVAIFDNNFAKGDASLELQHAVFGRLTSVTDCRLVLWCLHCACRNQGTRRSYPTRRNIFNNEYDNWTTGTGRVYRSCCCTSSVRFTLI